MAKIYPCEKFLGLPTGIFEGYLFGLIQPTGILFKILGGEFCKELVLSVAV